MNSNLMEANEFYKRSKQTEGISRVLKRSYIERAIRIYQTEMSKTTATKEFYPVLLKNLGMFNLKLGGVLDSQFDLDLIIFYLAEAVKAFTTAWSLNPSEQNSEWGGRIEGSISDCFEKAFQSVDGDATKFHLLDTLVKAILPEKSLDSFRVQFHLAKGQYFYRIGVKAMEGSDFKSTVQFLEYAREEIQLALKYASGIENNSFLIDIQSAEEDVSFLSFSCESVRLRVQADQLFDEYVMQSEDINFEIMWDILDSYKSAGLSCREKDLENEAIALSRQGRIFDKIFKIQPKAHMYYRGAFDLVQCLFPKDLNNTDWVKETKNALERFQRNTVREEEERKAREKAPYLEKLKPMLQELTEVHRLSDPFKLLKFVYTKHPPKGKHDYDENKVDASSIKKCIMQAITRYHPDKQVKYGMEWKILCEEITKCLTVRYECLK